MIMLIQTMLVASNPVLKIWYTKEIHRSSEFLNRIVDKIKQMILMPIINVSQFYFNYGTQRLWNTGATFYCYLIIIIRISNQTRFILNILRHFEQIYQEKCINALAKKIYKLYLQIGFFYEFEGSASFINFLK